MEEQPDALQSGSRIRFRRLWTPSRIGPTFGPRIQSARALLAIKGNLKNWEHIPRSFYVPFYVLMTSMGLLFIGVVFSLPFRDFIVSINIDDSFYYDQIARNFSDGKYSTFDGINKTNGYHPLWAMILTPIFFLVKNPDMCVRVAKIAELLLMLWASLLLMACGRRAGWSPVLAIVAPICLFGSPVLYSGMETSPQVLLYAALLHALMRVFLRDERRRPQVEVVLIACLLPWARLEALSTSAFAMIALTLQAVRHRHGLRLVSAFWMLLALSVGVYFCYNLIIFGSTVPVSGAVKAYWSSLRFHGSAEASLFHNLKLYLLVHKAQLAETALLVAMTMYSWSFHSYRSTGFRANQAVDAFVVTLSFSFVSRLLYGAVFIDIAYDNSYYYVPYFLLHAIALPYAFSRAFLLASFSNPTFGRPARASSLITCGIVLAVAAWHVRPWFLPAIWRRAPASPTWSEASFDGAGWMNRNLPPDAVVGSPDSGIVGFFTRRRVINLDGLVNSQEFFLAMKTQSVESWMHRAGITHLANAVRMQPAGGCGFIAEASAQKTPFRSPCVTVYKGLGFSQPWLGHLDRMQFQVYEFGSHPIPERSVASPQAGMAGW